VAASPQVRQPPLGRLSTMRRRVGSESTSKMPCRVMSSREG
jgi:hypothetical protein